MGKSKRRLSAQEVHRLMLDDLARSGLAKDWARLGCHPVEMNGFATTPRYRFPYFGLDGKPTDFYRDRFLGEKLPTDARGKPQRYTQPAGKSPRLYLAPFIDWRSVAGDTSVSLLITEGEKKAARACKDRLPCVGLGGVYNWRHRRRPIADLDLFHWRGRRVVIVFDSDATQNVNVQRAEFLLAAELQRRGASVRIKRLPEN